MVEFIGMDIPPIAPIGVWAATFMAVAEVSADAELWAGAEVSACMGMLICMPPCSVTIEWNMPASTCE